ncbi:DAK2 domain-containing protein [Brevibacillus ruminantium]|uniref:DAK2 domain-containing protein n=1 Tax=Brevibacillus ruminantium TaxID=2950604 RepID=A0ABY4WKR0_9BACL|nr:DAK2 domain-containing protein [Brevibacillus ruminantium]USG67672.1 DAK2 domain-containing protein [Brevibacillus ruminantium]
MVHKRLDGLLFSQMVYLGAKLLSSNAKVVDGLNVFPVPDGDTGTNMNLTLTSGAEELARRESPKIGESSAALAKGLLMGARGNSGVILSQLFRGFSKAVNGKDEINARQFAEALKSGVDSAYQAVMKPVEGTILTVAREAADMAVRTARTTDDVYLVMEKTYEQAQATLLRTPEMLPVLKEVGVVDSGGQGLLYVYEGFIRALRGETAEQVREEKTSLTPAYMDELIEEQHAQLHMKTEDIHFGYCTEFMVFLKNSTEANKKPFAEGVFRSHLDQMGDSLLVISDDELVKVHIHAEHPGNVLQYAQQFGSLHRIKIENMREQHANILREEEKKGKAAGMAADVQAAPAPALRYGLIAVAAGPGLAEIFRSMGVHVVVEGGQTMNPSTEDFLSAISGLNAEEIVILPNNSNIVMAAKQAAELAEKSVAVIPSKSIPQGMAALIAFNGGASLEENQEAMTSAIAQVKTGLVTHAVRDTKMGDVEIKEGDFIGIAEKEIVSSGADLMEIANELLLQLVDEDTGIVTIFIGEGADETQAEQLGQAVNDAFPDVDVEIHEGGQPLYPFIFAVE